MVLVAPDPVRQPSWEEPEGPGAAGLLARLHEPVGSRPGFEGLAGGLRAWLEDAAFTADAARGDGVPPLFLGPRRLLGPPDDAWASEDLPAARVLARLVQALFRQLVTAATTADPLGDALDALRADSTESDVVRHVESLGRGARSALAETLGAHAAHLRGIVPRFAPASLPRTDERVAIPLGGGRVVLGGVFDLLAGGGRSGLPLCAVRLTVERAPERDRWTLHYLALLQTLRSGTPPDRLVLLHSATGAYGVEEVREEHLRAAAAHVAAWLGGLAAVDADA
jgi:hypothetical protein